MGRDNILGSSISNVLGAFSLGLTFSPVDVVFDRSSKIYTGLLLVLTSTFVVFLVLFRSFGRIGDGILVAAFVIYVISIGYCIYKGMVSPPEDDNDDDDDNDSDNDSDSDSGNDDERRIRSRSSSSTLYDEEAAHHKTITLVDDKMHVKSLSHKVQVERRPRRSLFYYLTQLTLGLITLSLSGYVLSHSVSTIADASSLSENVIGITILSFATTLPEKLVAVFSSARKQSGIIVTNTAGSNIFLLTLCTGVLFLMGDLEMLKGM